MATITTTISEVKKNVPRHVLWIVLFSAFLVVVVLLVLLLGHGKKNKDVKAPVIALELATDPAEVEWLDSKIGEKLTQSIKITANTSAVIPNVKLSETIDGLSVNTTCTNMGEIAPELPCTAELVWTPKADLAKTGVKILIEYYPASAEAKMAKTAEIPVVLSTFVPPPPPPVKEEPKEEPKIELNPVSEAVDTLAPPMKEPQVTSALDTERCYEFSFGGYDTYGKQIGWIRPQAGHYLFHPFSDTNCTQPIGEYNPDTGFITDIKNPSKKIGSDFDRIGFIASGAKLPVLSNPAPERVKNIARQKSGVASDLSNAAGGAKRLSEINPAFAYKPTSKLVPSSAEAGDAFVSTDPYDRSFVLRQYKPIPATIVNEIRADAKIERQSMLPVQATVDRHVYSDNGRTIIIPTGTLMLGYLTGEMPGPYKAIGRMQIKWYRFVRPDGVEFSFDGNEPFAGDSQGRVGVPGHGSTDYMEQFIMPMITAIVPAAVNMIAPISDKFVNQIDLDNNTVTQSGQVKSSELAKNEIITTWNKVAQKLMVDMLDNTVPPFSIAAGTRITVYSPKDLVVNFCDKVDGVENCTLTPSKYVSHKASEATANYDDASWIGQVRGFNIQQFCAQNGQLASGVTAQTIANAGYDYRTVVAYCQSTQYQAKNNAKQAAVYTNQQQTTATKNYGVTAGDTSKGTIVQGNKTYNEQVLGLEYNEDGTIKNPFVKEKPPAADAALTCEDGNSPDANGCCAGENYTDMGEQGFNCCPSAGGDCFPPIK